ncbi:hypothetical protein A0J57_14040 [Sphingobium sp. 22B]|nr:hypothetical protein AXW74_15140 [Sphingobium sp. AM]KYC31739.1 hypothetical protein A0J57_14040 [Sphingobium sp. 22B]OAP31061.1 hypothetical protein A8O16_15425 [Sphingobium sp. 20006FA]
MAALHKRRAQPQGTHGAITESVFQRELKRLEDEFQADIEKLRSAPHSYRYWRPTADDWRRLAICQAMYAHESDRAESALLAPLPKKSRGRPKADMWSRAHFVYSARALIAKQQGISARDVPQKAASEKAAALIAMAARNGDWLGCVPSAATIEEAWASLHIDEYDEDGEPKSPEFPAWMRTRFDIHDHLSAIERAADRLGLQNQLPADVNDFLSWADGRIHSSERFASMPRSWADYHQQLAELPSKTQEKYRTAMDDYLKLGS